MLHLRKLTWQWKSNTFEDASPFKDGDVQCHVSFHGGLGLAVQTPYQQVFGCLGTIQKCQQVFFGKSQQDAFTSLIWSDLSLLVAQILALQNAPDAVVNHNRRTKTQRNNNRFVQSPCEWFLGNFPRKSRKAQVADMVSFLCLSINQTNDWKPWIAWPKSHGDQQTSEVAVKIPRPPKRQASYVVTVKQDLFQAMNVSFCGGGPKHVPTCYLTDVSWPLFLKPSAGMTSDSEIHIFFNSLFGPLPPLEN